MSCVKTGFHAFLEPHGAFLYGDAFRMCGAYVFRICDISYEPNVNVKHYTIRNWDAWFDENKTSTTTNSTMIASTDYVTDHGYDGIDVCR